MTEKQRGELKTRQIEWRERLGRQGRGEERTIGQTENKTEELKTRKARKQ